MLDLTGGAEVARPQTLALVRATVAAVEAELRLSRLEPRDGPPTGRPATGAPRLEVLGRRSARLTYGHHHRLSLRHSEIALLLAEAADGLAAAELAVALSEDDQAEVTIRAELSRLRRQLGPVRLGSRPYRLTPRYRHRRPAARPDLQGACARRWPATAGRCCRRRARRA